MRRAHCWEVIGDGTAQVRLLVARLREIEQIASDPAFESDAMDWILRLARVPLPEAGPCPVCPGFLPRGERWIERKRCKKIK